jgi:hypothetical protein
MEAMPAHKDPAERLGQVVAGATGSAAGATLAAGGSSANVVISSEHLLACLLGEDPTAEQTLAGLAVTSRTAFTVLRGKRQAASWSVAEPEGDAPPTPLSEADLGLSEPRRGLRRRRAREPMLVTPAVSRAVLRARAEQPTGPLGVRKLLLALLAEDDTRAAEVLTALGTSPAAVRARLVAVVSPAPVQDADPTLRFTRAMLLGRASYRPTSRSQGQALKLIELLELNWAATPADWATVVAQERAQRLGHPAVGSDDLLLGVLAVHEVALAAPPVLLPPDADHHYAGGDVLAASGVTYRTAVQAADRLAATERRGGLDDADAEALRSLGIDLDEVVRHAERALWPAALAQHRGAAAGRQQLGVRVEAEIAARGLRNRLRLRGDPFNLGALALTAIQDGTRAARLLTGLGVRLAHLRQRLQALTAAPPPPDPRRHVG